MKAGPAIEGGICHPSGIAMPDEACTARQGFAVLRAVISCDYGRSTLS